MKEIIEIIENMEMNEYDKHILIQLLIQYKTK
jgi:hypothetical protein